MRRAAGYSKDQDNLGVADLLKALPLPNLPGHRTFDNRGAPKSKAQTLRYVRGYPIVEDSVSSVVSARVTELLEGLVVPPQL